MRYREYLQTEEWKEKARACKERYGWRCALCNSGEETLNAHHRTYERSGSEDSTDLIALCRSCHEKHHDIQTEPEPDFEMPTLAQPILLFTDTWVVEKIASRLKDTLRFIPEAGNWHIWSGGN